MRSCLSGLSSSSVAFIVAVVSSRNQQAEDEEREPEEEREREREREREVDVYSPARSCDGCIQTELGLISGMHDNAFRHTVLPEGLMLILKTHGGLYTMLINGIIWIIPRLHVCCNSSL